MGIVCTTPKAVITKEIEAQRVRMRQALYNALSYVGEVAITEARKHHTYLDQTGNLTSSIGYIIVENGFIVRASNFNKVKHGDQGSVEGEELAKLLAADIRKGLVLIIVAGMKYASYVAHKGKNVLQSSEIKAEETLQKLKEKLGVL